MSSLAAGLLTAMPLAVLAHPGHEEASSFFQGLAHPFSGVDHVLAMVMVGLLAVRSGGRALWLLPAVFVAAMAVGSLAGPAAYVASAASSLEIGIALSVIVLGVLLALQVRLPLLGAALLVAAVALLHGNAHGVEAPGGVTLAYLGGFLSGTAALHLAGILAGAGLARIALRRSELLTRIAGVVGSGAGVFLLASI
ncbi:MAG: HupE/UreJ family protein [Lautropia sp.]